MVLKLAKSGVSLSTQNGVISKLWLHGEGLQDLQSVRIWNKKPITGGGAPVGDRVLYWKGTIVKANPEGTRALAKVKVNTPLPLLMADVDSEKTDIASIGEFLTVHVTVTIDDTTEPTNNQVSSQDVIIDAPDV